MSGANSMLESSQNRRKTAVGRNPMIRPDEAVSRAQETRMKGTELTGKQQLALTLIRRSLKERGVPPTRAELASEMGLAHPTSVDKHLIALERKGWADISRATSRGIRLLREGAPLLEEGDIPTIRAGTPILAEERREPKRLNDFESFSEHFDGTPDYFLRVRGDSLDKVGLRSGDLVAVQRTAHVHEGDLVVARIGQDVTLKRYHRKSKDAVELQPESTNPEHRSIPIDAHTEDAEIVGVVVGAIVGTRQHTRRHQEVGLGWEPDMGM